MDAAARPWWETPDTLRSRIPRPGNPRVSFKTHESPTWTSAAETACAEPCRQLGALEDPKHLIKMCKVGTCSPWEPCWAK